MNQGNGIAQRGWRPVNEVPWGRGIGDSDVQIETSSKLSRGEGSGLLKLRCSKTTEPMSTASVTCTHGRPRYSRQFSDPPIVGSYPQPDGADREDEPTTELTTEALSL